MRLSPVLIVITLLILASCTSPQLLGDYSAMRQCVEDSDCMCRGTVISTGDCFLGNKEWAEGRVNFDKGCPDFCGGEGGFLITKCVAGSCTQVSTREQRMCSTDTDCVCGGQIIESGDCFIGNKDWAKGNVDFSKDCPDFCTGIAGHLKTKCVKNQCTSVSRLQQNTAPAPAETQEPELIECNADADCVSTGCSGQLCLPRGKVQAKPMFTTCDYRDEYGCLKETSCG